MRSLYSLYMLVDKYASEIEKLDLDGDQLEEYSTVLLHLVETGEPSKKFVNECLQWLTRFTTKTSQPLHGNAA